jgi:murein DD-endopeptidase MepM/ murein hydrolase activator NlpD
MHHPPPRHLALALLLTLLLALPLPLAAQEAPPPRVEDDLQGFLAAQPGPLKSYRDGGEPAAEIIAGATAYYGVSPRLLLALLEASNTLLSRPAAPPAALERPVGADGPPGFAAQIDWAAAALRAGLGPYERPPILTFTDGTTATLTLAQAPEGLAVQRLLAGGRTQPQWRAAVARFDQAFQRYFQNELPEQQATAAPAQVGFLRRPWPEGTRVTHLAQFDHAYPTVDTGRRDNGLVVNYLGRGGVQYDGHDGHDFTFPDRPIGTYILAAADGVAYASTHRGNGVWIRHAGGYVTVYWHLDRFAGIFRGLVNSGRGVPVQAGTLIGTSGRSGPGVRTPHLHFEVRHNGRQVDPYGWYGAGPDPCTKYAGCAPSSWLWHPELIGEFNFTPPGIEPLAAAPPLATLTIDPDPDLLFLAKFDDHALQDVGVGAPLIAGAPGFAPTPSGRGLLIGAADRVAFPIEGNMQPAAGTILLRALIPERYPANSNRRHYIFAASANPESAPVYPGTFALRREIGADGMARWNFWTTPESGDAGRNDLTATDTLAPGVHAIALSWDAQAGMKRLFLNGDLVAQARGVALPQNIGELLEIGRFSPASGVGGIAIETLAIYRRALDPAAVAQEMRDPAPRERPMRAVQHDIIIDLNALDWSGGIMAVQFGIDGRYGDPAPFADSYRMPLPRAGRELSVRLFDRSGRSVTVSAALPPGRRVFFPALVRP